MSIRKNILFKLNLIYIAMIVFAFIIIGKIIYLQFFYDKELIAQAITVTTRYSEIEPNRGDIYSREGRLLATSVPYFEVGVDLNCDGMTQELFLKNLDSLAICLSNMFEHKTYQQYRSELIASRDRGARYYMFSSSLDYENFKKMKNFPLLRLGRFKGGFVYRQTTKREKPFGNLARRTIGMVESDKRRGVGLEAAYEEYLRGVTGYTVMQRIAGNLWMPVGDYNHIEPQDGFDLVTTIDIGIQDIVETALKNRMLYHDAAFGTAVVMEVSTGKIRAISNLSKTQAGDYVEDYNYAIGRASDPGSTLKLASVIAALEDGYVEPEDEVATGNGICYYHGYKMVDVLKGGYGTISIQKAFEVSSNVGISKIIYDNYKHQPEKFIDRLYKMHLNKPLGVIISGEANPFLPYPGDPKWSGISLTQISIGYEANLTPLQILAFYNAIANDGCLLKPVFAEEIKFRGETVKYFSPEIINPSICSKQTILKVKDMLQGVVENGTGRNIKSKNFLIAGKTGTAQMNYGQNAEKNEYHASFAGYFPADEPKYSMVVSIYKPQQNGYYGGSVASPVFKEIAEKIYSSDPYFYKYVEIDSVQKNYKKPIAYKSNKYDLIHIYEWLSIDNNLDKIANTDWVTGKSSENTAVYSPINFSDKKRVPNVLNMGVKDALILLEEFDFDVTVKGRGKVVKQIPAPNSYINGARKIEIILDV